MRPALFQINFDSIEEIQIGNFIGSKKSIHTSHQKSMNDNESFSIWQKTNSPNTSHRKMITGHNEKD